MIIAFIGGLGNQMFQYSIYRCALLKGLPVKGDLSYFNKFECHNGYELNRMFGISIDECSGNDLTSYKNKNDLMSRVIRKFIIKNYGINRNTIREDNSKFIVNLVSDKNSDKYLLGYWQSEKYFNEIEKEIRASFKFPDLTGKNKLLSSEIENSLSVSIHVRRGDYINNANTKIYTNLGETEYYSESIKYLKERHEDIKFFIFSNDVEWCKGNLPLPKDSVYIDWNKGDNSYVDMQLMSMCKHNIIANSSFSWWGAWLNNNPDKTVIAPKHWFTETSGFDDSNLIPEDWIRL